jgi:SAM-dependent methyltransferase
MPPNARILEIGCGTGHNFEMLGRFGRVDAIEVDDEARALASRGSAAKSARPRSRTRRHRRRLLSADRAARRAGAYQDDKASLASIQRKLAPGGRILLTVPANQWMWSAHDAVHHHHRRYSKRTLQQVVAEAGLQVHRISYFNTLLFPLAAAARIAGKLTGKKESDDKMPPPRSTECWRPSSAWNGIWSAGCRCRPECRWSRSFPEGQRSTRNSTLVPFRQIGRSPAVSRGS